MNKKFYFALALTAGLFASCSSDDLTAENAARQAEINDNAPAAITFDLNTSITRGTGTVGGLSTTDGQTAQNQWAGQKFNVFMFDKGWFSLATLGVDAQENPIPIFNNAVLTAPAAGAATTNAEYYVDNEDGDPVLTTAYYPDKGSFDFWAYRADDAASKDEDNKPIVKYTKDDGTAAAATVGDTTQVRIPFEIDGSQDIMLATTTAEYNGNTSSVTEDKLFSAYSSRRGVNPKFSFKHMLTRLKFYVIADSKEVSDAAERPAGFSATADWHAGFEVQSLTVNSKSKGELIVAWKGETEPTDRIVWDETENWADRDALPAAQTLASLTLKSREKEVAEAADIKMKGIAKTANVSFSYDEGYIDENGNHGWTYTTDTDRDNLVVYDSADKYEATGLPKGNRKKLSEITGTTGYILTYKAAEREHPTTNASYRYPDYEDGESTAETNLVDLYKVTPKWTAGTTTYTYEVSDDEEAYTAAAAANKQDVKVASGTTLAQAIAAQDAPTAAGKWIRFYIDEDGGTDNQFDDGELLGYALSTAHESAGSGVRTEIGEALLVAPNPSTTEATNGYNAILTYKFYKIDNANTATPTEVPVNVNIRRKAVVDGANVFSAFEPGKNYNIVIRLYKTATNEHNAEADVWEDEGDIEVDGE